MNLNNRKIKSLTLPRELDKHDKFGLVGFQYANKCLALHNLQQGNFAKNLLNQRAART